MIFRILDSFLGSIIDKVFVAKYDITYGEIIADIADMPVVCGFCTVIRTLSICGVIWIVVEVLQWI